MNINQMLYAADEKPLENLAVNGGYTAIFRRIGVVGDSLSSGEFESLDPNGNKGYHDYFEYSWGQNLSRMCGSRCFNFSRGGMTASEYCESFADSMRFWNPEYACQCYIIALGVNDIQNRGDEIGSIDDICKEDYTKNAKTFMGYYAQIIQRLKKIQPRAKFFLMTMMNESGNHRVREKQKCTEKLFLSLLIILITPMCLISINTAPNTTKNSAKNSIWVVTLTRWDMCSRRTWLLPISTILSAITLMISKRLDISARICTITDKK